MSRKVVIRTLGCKLNYSESQTYVRQLRESGFQVVDALEEADLLIINTCAVTEQAQKKCRQQVRKARNVHPTIKVALVGCYAALSADALYAQERVDLIIPEAEKAHVGAHCAALFGAQTVPSPCDAPSLSFFSAYSLEGRTRAFLKVQDGCDYGCTYCTIPFARGASRSPSVEEVLQKAKEIASVGIQEVVLTGVNTGDFAQGDQQEFLRLLELLAEVEGIERIRLSSIEPNLLARPVLTTMAAVGKYLPHLHIPLQSGSAQVLRRMGRRYTPAQYEEACARVRSTFPDAYIGMDVIVGFPTESDADFEQTVALVDRVCPAGIHVFPYSERPGTRALLLPGRVSTQEKQARVQLLSDRGMRLGALFKERFVGTVRPVLVEALHADGSAEGWTDNYIRMRFLQEHAQKGQIYPVRIV